MIERLAEKVGGKLEAIPASKMLAESYRNKSLGVLNRYRELTLTPPGSSETLPALSPELKVQAHALDLRAERAELKFKAVLDAFIEETPEAAAEETVDEEEFMPIPMEQFDLPAEDVQPLKEEAVTAPEAEPVHGVLHDDETFHVIRRKLEVRRPDKDEDRIRYESETEFRRTYPEKFKAYVQNEKTAIYRDHSGKPNILKDVTFNKMFLPRDLGGLGYSHSTPHGEMNAFADLVSAYPEKAEAYAETEPILRRMLDAKAAKK